MGFLHTLARTINICYFYHLNLCVKQAGPDETASGWLKSTFLTFSQLMQLSAMQLATNSTATVEGKLTYAPTAPYVVNGKATQLSYYIPIYLPLVFAFAVRNFAAQIVSDKQDKIRIGMKMLGLKDNVYWYTAFF